MLTPDIDIAVLSVRPSVTFWYFTETAQHIIVLFPHAVAQIILALSVLFFCEILTHPPPPYGGAEYR